MPVAMVHWMWWAEFVIHCLWYVTSANTYHGWCVSGHSYRLLPPLSPSGVHAIVIAVSFGDVSLCACGCACVYVPCKFLVRGTQRAAAACGNMCPSFLSSLLLHITSSRLTTDPRVNTEGGGHETNQCNNPPNSCNFSLFLPPPSPLVTHYVVYFTMLQLLCLTGTDPHVPWQMPTVPCSPIVLR